MFKKLVITLFCVAIAHSALAETCPSVADLHGNNLNGWTAYDLDGGDPLQPKQLKQFEQTVATFKEAQWLEGAPEGESQCYFGNIKGEFMNAYLARNGFKPDLSMGNWTNVQGIPTCTMSTNSCIFISD